ncbi:MAG: hypothetical protein HXS48_11495, partial [Theionarchaea archaeon]|nr:hypothetical protein [Theionarchaea archaeon]
MWTKRGGPEDSTGRCPKEYWKRVYINTEESPKIMSQNSNHSLIYGKRQEDAMIVGIDIGGTTTDAVAIKGKNVVRVISITASDPVAAASGALGKLITTLGCSLTDIETIVATGGGASSI